MDEEVGVIVFGGFISAEGAAFFAFMDDDEAFFGVGFGFHGAEDSFAIGCSVSGVNIQVEGGEAMGAMVTGGIAEGEDFFAAACADEAVVIFGKSFVFQWFDLLF